MGAISPFKGRKHMLLGSTLWWKYKNCKTVIFRNDEKFWIEKDFLYTYTERTKR